MTMLEKAAQEARETLWREHGTQFGPETMASLVRAVLLAIREPDERMADIMLQAGLSAVVTDDPLSFFRRDQAAKWTAGIDAILKEQP